MTREFTTENGHKFIVEGETSVGNYIRVTVIPSSGYVFDGWEFDYFMQPIDQDNDGNPIYKIKVNECGVRLIGRFEPISEPCDKEKIYYALCEIIGGECEKYEESSITCEEINRILGEIIGDGEQEARLIVVSDDINMGDVNIDGNGTEIVGMVGDTYNIYAEPTDCCNFEKWVDENGRRYSNNPKSVTLNANKTYTAYFSKRKYMITFDVSKCFKDVYVNYSINGMTNTLILKQGKVNTIEVECGCDIKLWVNEMNGEYQFVEWVYNGIKTQNTELVINNIKTNYVIQPVYKLGVYELTINKPNITSSCDVEVSIPQNSGNWISYSLPQIIEIENGDSVAVRLVNKTITPYTFSNWETNYNNPGGNDDTIIIGDMDNNYYITPKYNLIKCKIIINKPDISDGVVSVTYKINNNITVTRSLNNVIVLSDIDMGSSFEITGIDTVKYKCKSWTIDNEERNNNILTFTLDNEEYVIQPNYELQKYTVRTEVYLPTDNTQYEMVQRLLGDNTDDDSSEDPITKQYDAGSNVEVIGVEYLDNNNKPIRRFEAFYKLVNDKWEFLTVVNNYVINNLSENITIGGVFSVPTSNIDVMLLRNNYEIDGFWYTDTTDNFNKPTINGDFLYEVTYLGPFGGTSITNHDYWVNHNEDGTVYYGNVLLYYKNPHTDISYNAQSQVPLCFKIKSINPIDVLPMVECIWWNSDGSQDHIYTSVADSSISWNSIFGENNMYEGDLRINSYQQGGDLLKLNFLRYNLTYNISVYGYISSPNVTEYDITTSNYNFSVSILNYNGNGEEKYVIAPNNSTNTNVVSMGNTSILSYYGIHFKLRCTGVTPNASGNVIIPVYGKYLQENGEWANLTLASIPNDTSRWNQVSGTNDTYEYEVIIPSSNWDGLDNNGNYIRNIKLQINTQYI